MQIILYLFSLGALLLFLYFLHRAIINYFSLVSFLVFGKSHLAVYLYFLFFLPGVILHELAHLFSASILGVPTGRLEVFPHKTEEGWILGRVARAETDILRSSVIGLAPMIIGTVSLVLIVSFGLEIKNLTDVVNFLPTWKTIFWLYLMLAFTNTMFLSKEDKTSIWAFPSLLIILFLLGRAMGLVGILTAIENLFYTLTSPLILSFSLTILLDLLFFVFLVLLTEILVKIRG